MTAAPPPEPEQSRTLVLNATYQPLTVVSARRGVLLLLDEAVDLVESTGRFYRSPSISVPEPSVVRLREHAHTPFRCRLPLTRKAVLFRDHGLCGYCRRPADTVDHIVPRSRGGTHTWGNVIAACGVCNRRKADRTPQEAGMELLGNPFEPRGRSAVRVALKSVSPTWDAWLGELRESA